MTLPTNAVHELSQRFYFEAAHTLRRVVEAFVLPLLRWRHHSASQHYAQLLARELAQRGGCYAEAIVVPQDAPYPLHPTVAFEDAVSLPNLQLALALMRVAGTSHRPQPHVLITGASGGVAGMLCQVAKHRGFATIGTSRTADKSQYARDHGFDHVVCTEQDDLMTQIQTLTILQQLTILSINLLL